MTLEDMQSAKGAEIIVNELYDTELLGEGVLPTLRHALEVPSRLLLSPLFPSPPLPPLPPHSPRQRPNPQSLTVPDAIVVPAKADIIVRLLESHQLWTGHSPGGSTPSGADIFCPPTGRLLAGASPPQNPLAASKGQRTYPSESFFVDKLVSCGSAAWESESRVSAVVDFCDPPPHGTHKGEPVELRCVRDGFVHGAPCPPASSPSSSFPPF